MAGTKVIGAAAGKLHTAVWTEKGELLTFGKGYSGQMGHRGTQDEHVPRLVEALAGKKVIGAAAGDQHKWCGPMRRSSSPSGMEALGSWVTEGIRVSVCRGWSRPCSLLAE